MSSSALKNFLKNFGFSENLADNFHAFYTDDGDTVIFVFRQDKCQCLGSHGFVYPECKSEEVVLPETQIEVYLTKEEILENNYPYNEEGAIMDDSGEYLYPALVNSGEIVYKVCSEPDSPSCGCPSCEVLYKATSRAKNYFIRDNYIYLTMQVPEE